MPPFVHLSCCSWYSFLRGTYSPAQLVQAAKDDGAEAVALTDYRGLYGAIPFYLAAKEAGIRPLFGASFDTPTPGASMVVLARNLGGYSNLCRLITDEQLLRPKSQLALRASKQWDIASAEEGPDDPKSRAGKPDNENVDPLSSVWADLNPASKVSLPELALRYSDGLIFLTSDPDYLRFLSPYISNDRLYIELFQADSRRSRQLIRSLVPLADELGLRMVATNRVHFLSPEDFELHRLVSAIRTLKTVETLTEEDHAESSCRYLTSREMEQLFAAYPDALEAAADIARQCEVELPVGKNRIPRFDAPDGSAPEQFLQTLCEQGILRLYPAAQQTAARARLAYELDTINAMNYASYFLIVWDIVRFARESGIPSTGRGSAADSIVSYLLGLTHVDPIQHNLYFERFLSRERSNPPDIDIDFCWKRRDEVIRYAYRRWGQGNVAMISVHNTLSGRSCIREVGKALGLSEDEVGQYTRFLTYLDPINLEKMQSQWPEARGIDINSEPIKSILPLARRLQGFPSHMGIHSSGIVVAPEPLTNWVPLERAAKGLVVTQFDMYPIEDLGLLKIDLLGQRSLSVIADVCGQVRDERDPEFNLANISIEQDEPTLNRMAAGRTMGVFQVESPGMRGVLQRVQARDFETVTAASSVIRPGPKDSGMLRSWVRRQRGLEPASYLHPRLREILAETHGIMVYQEDVLKVAQAIAGMSMGRADVMRRSMTGKRSPQRLATMKGEFLEGAGRNGIPADTAAKIWKQMEAFAGYAFCKAHSASFSVLSFQSCYLKEHYPAEFMAAVIANGGGFYDRAAYVSEARRLGLEIRLPSINQSGKDWTGRESWIRCGLGQVRDVRESSVDDLLRERRAHGPFLSLENALLRLSNLEKGEWENLILCGACDQFPKSEQKSKTENSFFTRPQLIWFLDTWFRKKATASAGEQLDFLLEQLPDSSADASISEIPDLPQFPFERLYDDEARLLEVSIRCHPLQRFRKLLPTNRPGLFPAEALPTLSGKRAAFLGWMVISRRLMGSNKRFMKFLTLEDETEIYEAIMFDKAYQKYGHLTLTRGPFMVAGRVDDQEGYCSLHIDYLELLGR